MLPVKTPRQVILWIYVFVSLEWKSSSVMSGSPGSSVLILSSGWIFSTDFSFTFTHSSAILNLLLHTSGEIFISVTPVLKFTCFMVANSPVTFTEMLTHEEHIWFNF